MTIFEFFLSYTTCSVFLFVDNKQKKWLNNLKRKFVITLTRL